MKPIELKVSADDDKVAYVYLPNHPGNLKNGVSVKQIELSEILGKYEGPSIYLDFDANGCLIGIEILG